MRGLNHASDEEISTNFKDLRSKGMIGLMYNGGHDPETYRRIGEVTRE